MCGGVEAWVCGGVGLWMCVSVGVWRRGCVKGEGVGVCGEREWLWERMGRGRGRMYTLVNLE